MKKFKKGEFDGVYQHIDVDGWTGAIQVVTKMRGDLDYDKDGLENLRLVLAAPKMFRILKNFIKHYDPCFKNYSEIEVFNFNEAIAITQEIETDQEKEEVSNKITELKEEIKRLELRINLLDQ